MRNICRFKECGQFGQMNAVYIEVKNGETFEMEWCTKCGRIQNKF